MLRIIRLLVCTTLFYGANLAQAGSSQGLVSNIFVHTPGVLMFQAGATINSMPPCANSTKQWAISLSDPMGKPLLAVLLSAQAQGKQVIIYGYTNTCRDWPDRELPSFAVIVD